MLSTRERLVARQGQHGTPRHEYLQQLVSEYQRTSQWLRREEIVANLANFAYDPINYTALRELRVVPLFVDIVATHGRRRRWGSDSASEASDSDADEAQKNRRRSAGGQGQREEDRENVRKSKALLVEFAMGGICNCIADPRLQPGFMESDGVGVVLPYVMSVGSSDFVSADAPASSMASAWNATLSALTIVYFLLDSAAFETVTETEVMAHMSSLASHSSVQIANIASAYLSRYEELLREASIAPNERT